MSGRFPIIRGISDYRYKKYLPTAFDDSLTLVEKVNKVIYGLNSVIDDFNDVTGKVDKELDEQQQKIVNLRDEFESLKEDIGGEYIPQEVEKVINILVDDGSLAELINDTLLDSKADKSEVDSLTSHLMQMLVNVKSFGAKGDGTTDDTSSIRSALSFLKNNGGGNLFFPAGVYIVDFVLKIDFDVAITGVGNQQSVIKVKDNSTLFHNQNRTNNSGDYDLEHLYRDFHSVFFFVDSNFLIDGIQIDGNVYNQIEFINGENWNVVEPTEGLVDYYKYFHGVQAIYKENKTPNIIIKNSYIHSCPWNNVVIGNNNPLMIVPNKCIFENNVFGSSSRDSLSIHRMSDVSIENNTFINPISHSLHIYYNVKNSLVTNNLFLLDSGIKSILPLETTRFKDFIQLGQGDYVGNVIEETVIKDNLFLNKNTTLNNSIRGVNVTKNIKSLSITGNKFKNLNDCINVSFPTIDNTIIENNEMFYYSTGVALRPFRSPSGDAGKNDDVVIKPYDVNVYIKNNVIKHMNVLDDDMSVSLYTYGDSSKDEISNYNLTLIGNDLSGSRILNNNITNITRDFKYSDFITHKRGNVGIQNIEPNRVRKVFVPSGAFKLGSSVVVHPEFELPENISFSCYIVENGVCQLLLSNPTLTPTTVPAGSWLFKIISTEGNIG